MATTEKVYRVTPSLEEGRPFIDFTLPQNARNDWLLVDQVLRGERHEKDYPAVLILVHDAAAESWDLYSVAGTLGLMSERAVNVLAPFASEYFRFFQVSLNGGSFFFLKRKRALNCIDRERTDIAHLSRFCKGKRQLVFGKQLIPDPLLFSIPDTPGLFGTQSIKGMVQDAELRGFEFTDAELRGPDKTP